MFLDALRYRFRVLFRREQYGRELEEEIAHFMELEAQSRFPELDAQSRPNATPTPLGTHMNRTYLNEERRIVSGLAMIDHLQQDARFALRFLSRRRVVAAIMIATLALGIGAATSMFSVADVVLFRPLAFPGADRLVTVWRTRPDLRTTPGRSANWDRFGLSMRNLRTWRAAQRSFSSIGAWTTTTTIVATDGGAEELKVVHATASMLPTLGVQPELGRNFSSAEDAAGGEPVALVSHETWATKLGEDPKVLGRHVVIDSVSYSIIGVMPPGVTLDRTSAPAAYWIPASQDAGALDDDAQNYWVIGRLAANVSMAGAIDETTRLASMWPTIGTQPTGVRLAALKDEQTRNVRQPLLILLAASAVLLLIACANVAVVLMGELMTRDRELRARLALGASRSRLVRQLLTESVVLAGLAGIIGTLVSVAGVRLIVRLAPSGVPGLQTVHVDPRILVVATAVSLATGLIAGLVPTLLVSRSSTSLDTRAAAPSGSAETQRGIVAIEVALSVVLLVGAALLVESFARINAVDVGFRREHLLALRLRLPRPQFDDSVAQRALYADLLTRIRALPDVDHAAATTSPPFSGGSSSSSYQVEGRTPSTADLPSDAQRRVTSSDYFATAGMPLVDGRAYGAIDDGGAPPVIVVSQSLARREWPNQSAIGKRVKWIGQWRTVVGVVVDVKLHGLFDRDLPTIYAPMAQLLRGGDPWVVVHARSDDPSLVPTLRAIVRQTAPSVAVGSIDEMAHLVTVSIADERFRTQLMSAFAILAAILAAVGMYGVATAAANRRTQELAIRSALGATNASIVGLIVRSSTSGVVIGATAGVGLAWFGTRALTPYLYGVGHADPTSYALVLVLLTATTLAATWIPARRVTRTPLVEALRPE